MKVKIPLRTETSTLDFLSIAFQVSRSVFHLTDCVKRELNSSQGESS